MSRRVHTAVMTFLCPTCRDQGHERGFEIRIELPAPVIRQVEITCHRCGKTVMWYKDIAGAGWQKQA